MMISEIICTAQINLFILIHCGQQIRGCNRSFSGDKMFNSGFISYIDGLVHK